MAAHAPGDRMVVLAKRVHWLETRRRLISVPLAAIAWILLSRELASLFGSSWSPIAAATTLFAAAVWWIIEIVFAWMIAMWETELDQLTRDGGLPRAQLVRRR